MKEIGGYFGLEQLVSNEYYRDLIPLNSGRTALWYLLKAKRIRKLYIPYYLCDVIRILLESNSYEYEYYRVGADFMPIFHKSLEKDEYLYVVNYYGQITDEKVIDLKKRFGQIIMDNTHAFFQKPLPEVDTIYSCRKFFGVSDGAYLATNARMDEEYSLDLSKGRMTHILGRFEGTAQDYRDYSKANDESFIGEPIKHMSKLTHNILGAIDYETVRRTRNENFAFLERELKNRNILKLTAPDGAFAYPVYHENAVEIRKELAKKRIYITTLWAIVFDKVNPDSIEYKYAANIMPLPCDQRYDKEDMEKVAGFLKEVW